MSGTHSEHSVAQKQCPGIIWNEPIVNGGDCGRPSHGPKAGRRSGKVSPGNRYSICSVLGPIWSVVLLLIPTYDVYHCSDELIPAPPGSLPRLPPPPKHHEDTQFFMGVCPQFLYVLSFARGRERTQTPRT